ncbi:kelch-like protein 8 [Centruroides sculpturatus]|uniref:kelch-like protein 8 n=1 Tax=Centruroides sculpturatus TaxID=218467 RepID=UPI000C6CA5AE|nr:kelch-like protein 8 [Centruroides sculpturatus]XP_023214579.1 kelch-like protein 8 [Centruroides sculpturatus]XP_023214580.1 kelch-like protein 8 [Centruroides sculpturatus]
MKNKIMGEQLIEEPSPYYTYESKGMFRASFQKLYRFLKEDVLCDVEIRTGRKAIRCHRVVLACCSPYFQAMFTNSLAESRQKIITISEIDESAMELLINFAYTAKVELNVTNAQSVLHAASVLQLEALIQACCEFMQLHLHPTNCLSIRQFAEQHGLMSLAQQADAFTCFHFQEVLKSDELLTISANHLQDLISSPNLYVENEAQVCETVFRWVHHNVEKRKDLLPSLLSKVKLPLLTQSYLKRHVEPQDLVRRNLECRDLLDEARDFQLWQVSQLPCLRRPSNELTRPRKSYAGTLFCVGGRGISGEPFSSIECYNWFRNSWFNVVSMNTKRRHVACISIEGKIYAVGGCNDKEHLSSVEVFNPLTNKWNFIASMSTSRRGLGLSCLGGPIYAVGGLDDNSFYATVERYDISSDTWYTVTSMNEARGGVAVATLKGFLYAIGGNNGPNSLSSCEKYDPHLNKWIQISQMRQSRAGAGAAVLDGFLYVVGGFDNNIPLNSVERYDPETNTWTNLSSMTTCRGGVGVASLGGHIFAVGGHNGSSYLDSVEMYDPLQDRWETMAKIGIGRAGAGVAWCPCSPENLYNLNRNMNENQIPT